MNLLNQSDLSNRPALKYIIIALVAVNAIVLALLLFMPGRLSPSASTGGPSAASAGATVQTDESDTEEEDKDTEDDEDEHTENEEYKDTEDEEYKDAEDENASEESYSGATEESAEEGSTSGPVLELVDDHVTLKVGDYFNFYDYIKTMKDRDGSDLSHYIHLNGEVNTYTPGDYTVTFQITSPIDGQTASEDLRVTVEY